MRRRIEKYTGNSSGFSFVELMVVIALVGILAAVGVPSFLRSLPEKRLQGVTRNLYADLQNARLLAVMEHRDLTVRFDTAADPGFYYFDSDGNGTYDAVAENFTDSNGDGSYTSGEPFTDTNGSGTYTAIENQRNFNDTAPDVNYGCDATSTNWNTEPITAMDSITFLSTGIVSPNFGGNFGGSIYLQSENKQEICYAVTVTTFGAVKIRRFNGSDWE